MFGVLGAVSDGGRCLGAALVYAVTAAGGKAMGVEPARGRREKKTTATGR